MPPRITTLTFQADLTGILGQVQDSIDGVVEKLQDIGDPLANAFDNAKVDVSNALDQAVLVSQEKFGEMKGAAEGAFDDIPSKVGPRLRAAGSALATTFGESFAEVRDVVQDQIKYGMKDALEAVGVDPELAASIGRNVGQLSGTIGDALSSGIGGKVADIGTNIATKLTEGPVGIAISGAMGSLGTAAGSVMDLAIAAAPLLLPALLIAGIVAAIAIVINDPSIPGKALNIGVEIVRGLLEGLVGLLHGLAEHIVGAVGGVIETAASLPGRAAAIGIAIVGSLIDGIAGIVGGGISLVKQLVGAIVDAVGGVIEGAAKLPGEAAAIGVAIVGSLVDGVLGLAGHALSLGAQLIGAVVDAVGSVVDGAKGLASAAAGIGAEIVKQAINGVLGLVGGVVSLAKQLADAVTSAVESIGSPIINFIGKIDMSRVLTEIGNAIPGVRFVTGGAETKATGGEVFGGVAYTVGERGAETFVPYTNGTIVPHGAGGPSVSVTGGVHMHIHGSNDPAADVKAIDDEWERQFHFRLSELGA